MRKIIQPFVNYSLKAVQNPIKEEVLHINSFIEVWSVTTIIMWFYVLFSYWVFDFPLVGHLGVLYSLIHTLCPVFFRYTKSLSVAGITISLSALFFQVTFCIYNGGIDSPSAIWLTAHPVIISFFARKALVLFSVILNMFLIIGLTLMGHYNIFPVDALSLDVTQIMKVSSLIGLDIVIATYTIVFINKNRNHHRDLEQTNELIENLLRIIGHDINNSLTLSVGAIRNLNRKNSDPELQKYINFVIKANNEIYNVTDSIKSWMKVKDGKLNLKSDRVSLLEITNFINTRFDSQLVFKNLKIIINNKLDDDFCFNVNESAFKLNVICNILSNSIKFSHSGGIIFVNIEELDKKLYFHFVDQGVGIPEDSLKDLFKPKNSSSRKGTKGESGTGFGLPIVKAILHELEGDIEVVSKVASEEDKTSGTTVSISLPLYV